MLGEAHYPDDAFNIKYDLTELNLVDHTLPANSHFEPVAHESNMGNIYMVSAPVEGVRDPEGRQTHDGVRFVYFALNTNPALRFDPVVLLEEAARNSMLIEDRRTLPISPIHTNPERTAAYIVLRHSAIHSEITQFYIAQVMPDTDEILVLNFWMWVISPDTISSIRHDAVVEIGQHIGIDFISYFDGISAFN